MSVLWAPHRPLGRVSVALAVHHANITTVVVPTITWFLDVSSSFSSRTIETQSRPLGFLSVS